MRHPDPDWVGTMFGHDTVGAIALDRAGNLAAGTSTGGMPFKPPGRVGDSPFIGAGLYADNETGAVSTTGHGERIIPVVLAKRAADLMGEGLDPQAAAERALATLARVEGRGRADHDGSTGPDRRHLEHAGDGVGPLRPAGSDDVPGRSPDASAPGGRRDSAYDRSRETSRKPSRR